MTYEEVLARKLEEMDDLVILTAENRAAIRNLPPLAGNRFIDFGIAEMTMLGAAAGLASRGRIPVAHALATFLTMRAYEFARTDIGIPGFPVKLAGGVPGFLSEANGPTHQAVEDIGIMRSIPGMNIFCPSDNEEMLAGLETILPSPQPWYIRFNNRPATFEHETPWAEGKAEVIGSGTDVAILTYGLMAGESYKAMELLEDEGIRPRLMNFRTLKPIDVHAITAAADDCFLLVTVEDHFLTGGLYSILAEELLRQQRQANVVPIALNNRWFKPALLGDVLEYEGFTAEQIKNTIIHALRTSAQRRGFAKAAAIHG